MRCLSRSTWVTAAPASRGRDCLLRGHTNRSSIELRRSKVAPLPGEPNRGALSNGAGPVSKGAFLQPDLGQHGNPNPPRLDHARAQRPLMHLRNFGLAA